MAIIFSFSARGFDWIIGSTHTIRFLLELLLQRGRQVFRHPQRFHGNINRGDTRRFNAIGAKVGNPFLDGNVIGILTEKVGLHIEKE
jgi:hypothetical protein